MWMVTFHKQNSSVDRQFSKVFALNFCNCCWKSFIIFYWLKFSLKGNFVVTSMENFLFVWLLTRNLLKIPRKISSIFPRVFLHHNFCWNFQKHTNTYKINISTVNIFIKLIREQNLEMRWTNHQVTKDYFDVSHLFLL